MAVLPALFFAVKEHASVPAVFVRYVQMPDVVLRIVPPVSAGPVQTTSNFPSASLVADQLNVLVAPTLTGPAGFHEAEQDGSGDTGYVTTKSKAPSEAKSQEEPL